jgi:hypothetical protein
LRALSIAAITHPTIASLGHPLFAFGGKRVGIVNRNQLSFPICGREGRARSVAGLVPADGY